MWRVIEDEVEDRGAPLQRESRCLGAGGAGVCSRRWQAVSSSSRGPPAGTSTFTVPWTPTRPASNWLAWLPWASLSLREPPRRDPGGLWSLLHRRRLLLERVRLWKSPGGLSPAHSRRILDLGSWGRGWVGKRWNFGRRERRCKKRDNMFPQKIYFTVASLYCWILNNFENVMFKCCVNFQPPPNSIRTYKSIRQHTSAYVFF